MDVGINMHINININIVSVTVVIIFLVIIIIIMFTKNTFRYIQKKKCLGAAVGLLILYSPNEDVHEENDCLRKKCGILSCRYVSRWIPGIIVKVTIQRRNPQAIGSYQQFMLICCLVSSEPVCSTLHILCIRV